MAKTQTQEKVILETTKPLGKANKIVRREFDYEHAKSLLNYEKAMKVKEWQLPKDSNYTLDNDGNLIQRGGPQANKGAQVSTGDPGGEGKENQA